MPATAIAVLSFEDIACWEVARRAPARPIMRHDLKALPR
jgi:hypothetical protein